MSVLSGIRKLFVTFPEEREEAATAKALKSAAEAVDTIARIIDERPILAERTPGILQALRATSSAFRSMRSHRLTSQQEETIDRFPALLRTLRTGVQPYLEADLHHAPQIVADFSASVDTLENLSGLIESARSNILAQQKVEIAKTTAVTEEVATRAREQAHAFLERLQTEDDTKLSHALLQWRREEEHQERLAKDLQQEVWRHPAVTAWEEPPDLTRLEGKLERAELAHTRAKLIVPVMQGILRLREYLLGNNPSFMLEGLQALREAWANALEQGITEKTLPLEEPTGSAMLEEFDSMLAVERKEPTPQGPRSQAALSRVTTEASRTL